MLSRRYDEAIEEYRQLLDLDCFFYKGFTSMGRVYAQKGMYEEAITMLQKGRSLAGEIPSILGALGQTYAMLRRRTTRGGCWRSLPIWPSGGMFHRPVSR